MPNSKRTFVWWTRERVLAALRAYHAETGVVIVSSPTWDQIRPKAQDGRRSAYPSSAAILRYWPSLRQAWLAAGISVNRQRDVWLPADHEYLRQWWGRKRDQEIAAHLDRSVSACIQEIKRSGLPRRRDNNGLSMRVVGEVFGIDPKTALRFHSRGWVTAVKGTFRQGPHEVWSFCPDCVAQFIKTMPWAYDWKRMQPGHPLTELAREVNERDPWLTMNEFYEAYGRSKTFVKLWTSRGLLPFRRRPKQQNSGDPGGLIVFRKRDIDEALPTIAAEVVRIKRKKGRETRQRLGKSIGGWHTVQPAEPPPMHLGPGDWVRLTESTNPALRPGREGEVRRLYWGFAGSRHTGRGGHKQGGRWMAEVALVSPRIRGEKSYGVPIEAIVRVGPRFSAAVIEGPN